jgi:hypothetical protein
MSSSPPLSFHREPESKDRSRTGSKVSPKKGQESKPVTRTRETRAEPAHLDSLEALCRDGHRVHTVRIMQDGADQAGNAIAYRPRGIAFELDDLVCAVHNLQNRAGPFGKSQEEGTNKRSEFRQS